MKILILAPHPFFQNRGTPIAVRMLAESLADMGHQIDILTYHEGEDLKDNRIRIFRIPGLPGIQGLRPGFSWKKIVCDALMMAVLPWVLRRQRYDILHATEESVFLALLVKKLKGVPYVYDMDSSLVHQMTDKYPFLSRLYPLMAWFEGQAVRHSDGVLAVCRALEELALRYAPYQRVVRLEDASLLGGDHEQGIDLRERFGFSGPSVVYVGNLERYQGIDLLIEGFAATETRESHLVIIGGSVEDIRRYGEKASGLGVGGRVHFVGFRPVTELASYLRQADILVSPRTQGENTPMKIYSYLDSGKPVLATELATHTQVLDADIAMLVRPEPKAMAEGLDRLLKDAKLRETIGRQARQRVAEEYSVAAFRRKLLCFYERLPAMGTVP